MTLSAPLVAKRRRCLSSPDKGDPCTAATATLKLGAEFAFEKGNTKEGGHKQCPPLSLIVGLEFTRLGDNLCLEGKAPLSFALHSFLLIMYNKGDCLFPIAQGRCEIRKILSITFLGFIDTHMLIPIVALYATGLSATVGTVGLTFGERVKVVFIRDKE